MSEQTALTINWAALRAPFNPNDVDFRLQSVYEKDGKTKGIAIAYMDARLVQERLDDIVGPQNWSFDWQPMATKDNAVIAAKGILTILGVSKSDIGDCDATEKNKASVSDALKRAAVMWGIGRYLYGLGTFFCETEKRGKNDVIPESEIKKMRGKLPHSNGQKATSTSEDAQSQDTPRPPAAPTQLAPRPTPQEGVVQSGKMRYALKAKYATVGAQDAFLTQLGIDPTLKEYTAAVYQHVVDALQKAQVQA